MQEKPWLRNRITSLAVLQAAGNPLRELEACTGVSACYWKSLRAAAMFGLRWDPQQEQERLQVLQRQEQLVAEQDRQLGFAPFPVTYRLPELFEDLARLAQARAGCIWRSVDLASSCLWCVAAPPAEAASRLLRRRASKRWVSVMR